jgi:hypothetical protein
MISDSPVGGLRDRTPAATTAGYPRRFPLTAGDVAADESRNHRQMAAGPLRFGAGVRMEIITERLLR